MNTKRFLFIVIAVVMLLLSAACARENSEGGSASKSAGTYDQLLSALQSAGLGVEEAGTISQPFFGPEGKIIKVDGQDIQVFEFSTAAEAEEAAGTISPEGGSVGTTMVTWIEPPHFFQSERLILLYLGENAALIKGLEEVLGPQIAGQ